VKVVSSYVCSELYDGVRDCVKRVKNHLDCFEPCVDYCKFQSNFNAFYLCADGCNKCKEYPNNEEGARVVAPRPIAKTEGETGGKHHLVKKIIKIYYYKHSN